MLAAPTNHGRLLTLTKNLAHALCPWRQNNTNNAVTSGSNQMAEEGRDTPDPGGGAGGIGRGVGGNASVCNKKVSLCRVVVCWPPLA